MFGRFFPKPIDFLDLFEKAADNVLEGARLFHALVSDFRDVELKTRKIKSVETQGDRITHDAIDRLNKTFITPIDREDIHALVSRLDDILDLIDAAAQRLVLYRIQSPTPELVALSEQLIRPVETIKRALLHLDKSKNGQKVLADCQEIDRLEAEADELHRLAISTLFDKEKDPIQILKWKEIYEDLEDATDRCQDVANIIEGVVIKNS
jgi:predicted phosphate transport protein (TIGR00153 family)